jgi:hypothetical protein
LAHRCAVWRRRWLWQWPRSLSASAYEGRDLFGQGESTGFGQPPTSWKCGFIFRYMPVFLREPTISGHAAGAPACHSFTKAPPPVPMPLPSVSLLRGAVWASTREAAPLFGQVSSSCHPFGLAIEPADAHCFQTRYA